MKGTIKSSRDLESLFKSSKKIKSNGILLLIDSKSKERGRNNGRVAFVAGKKIGNSPKRNYAKRIMRSVAKDLNLPCDGFDIVFVANSRIFNFSYKEILDKCRVVLLDQGLTI